MFLPLFWVFSLGSGFGTILAFMPDLVLERGIGVVRPFYLAYPAAVATVRLGFGHLFDRHSLPRVVLLPLAMLPACMIFIWQADSWLLLAAAGAAYGIAHGVLFPALMGYLMDNSPPHFRGRMSLVFNMCFSGGIFGAANIGGLFVDGSVQPVFFWMALYTAAGLFLLAGRQVARLLKA